MKTVGDIMVQNVVTVSSEMPVVEAARSLVSHAFDGLPVVDKDNVLVGILTEYDLIHFIEPSSGTGDFAVMLAERFSKMTVGDVMNTDPLAVRPQAPAAQVAMLFRDHHRVNPIPVVDEHRKVVGVVSRYDIIKLVGDSVKV